MADGDELYCFIAFRDIYPFVNSQRQREMIDHYLELGKWISAHRAFRSFTIASELAMVFDGNLNSDGTIQLDRPPGRNRRPFSARRQRPLSPESGIARTPMAPGPTKPSSRPSTCRAPECANASAHDRGRPAF